MSVENQIIKAISNHKRGKIFFPNSFLQFGTPTAVRQALNRIENTELLIRLAHGIYLYPKKHKTLGILQPSTEEIAIAIAKRDKARIIPTGVQALNKLGLSTQVPMNVVYLTDGTPRMIKIGKRSIKFKIASPKLLSAKSDVVILVIQAMREIGKDKISPVETQKIKQVLLKEDVELIKHDIKLAPTWITNIINELIKS